MKQSGAPSGTAMWNLPNDPPLVDGKPIKWDERDQCFRFIESKGPMWAKPPEPTQAEIELARLIILGWVMDDAPGQITLGDARKLCDRIARGIAGRLKL